jgi:hypothetical protein
MMVPCRDSRGGFGASYGSHTVAHNSIWPPFPVARVKNLWLLVMDFLTDTYTRELLIH